MKTSQKFGSRLCTFAGVGLLAVFYGPLVVDDIRAAFPGDALHAAALRDCALENTAFNRLDQAQRADCYATHPGLMRDARSAPNEVDLRMSAGRGHQPQNDVIQQQQLMDYFAVRSAQRDR
jgi:hypothetical protein